MTRTNPSQIFSASWAARTAGAELDGDDIEGLKSIQGLESAGPHDVTFLTHPKYNELASKTASLVLIALERPVGFTGTVLKTQNPYLAVATLANALLDEPEPAQRSPHARIHETAVIGNNVSVGDLAYIGPNARIGDDVRIEATAYVGSHAVVGKGAHLHPGAKVLDRCTIGERVILQAGAIVGSDGFGYAPDEHGVRHKIPQIGIVVLEDDVELGANTTVDRATFGETRIGRGTKLDNLVQIGHNVQTGQDCVIVAQSGVAGSTTLGSRVIAGAQSGISGHVQVSDDVVLTARAGIIKSTPAPGIWSGFPSMKHNDWLRYSAGRSKQQMYRAELRKLAKRIEALEGPDDDS